MTDEPRMWDGDRLTVEGGFAGQPSRHETAEESEAAAEPADGPVPSVPSVPSADAGDAWDEGEASTELSRGLLFIVGDEAVLFHDRSGVPYAHVTVNGHREVWPIGGRHFKEWLVALYFEEHGSVPRAQQLADALLGISGRARFRGEEHAVYLRIAGQDDFIVVDLANDAWEAAEIGPRGWEIVSSPPVLFRRTRGMSPLPPPIRGGSIDELRPFLNVNSEDGWRLIVAWLLFAFSPTGPYPVLILHGEQGSAKSTAARVLRSLVDPAGGSGLRAAPKDQEDLAVASHNGWLLAFDNLSSIRPWLSDALCRIATGGGLSKRELYSDAEEVVLDACRPIVMNGINELATRGDLLDRALIIDLEPIGERERRTEAEFWAAFERARPRILGALFDALALALKALPDVVMDRKPRMADFARFGTAIEHVLGWDERAFLRALEANRESANDLALDASPVGVAIRDLIGHHATAARPFWVGTADDLRRELMQFVTTDIVRSEFWPKNAWAMGNRLERLAPNLRATGIGVHKHRKAHGNRERLITLWDIARFGGHPPTDDGDAGDDSVPRPSH